MDPLFLSSDVLLGSHQESEASDFRMMVTLYCPGSKRLSRVACSSWDRESNLSKMAPTYQKIVKIVNIA